MKLRIDLIKPAPEPIRKTWDHDKLEELAQSIKEQGLIVPIKVRPANDLAQSMVEFWDVARPGISAAMTKHPEFQEKMNYAIWEVVYGHRRLEASKMAGLDEIEAIVDGVDDTDALIQALIENVIREDMNDIDKRDALIQLQEKTGANQIELGKMLGLSHDRISQLIKITDTEKEILRLKSNLTAGHVHRSRYAKEDSIKVLEKAAEEELSFKQIENVAKSVAATKDPRMREKLINAPYSPYTHDPEYAQARAERYGTYDPAAIDKSPPLDEAWKLTAEVSVLLEFIKKSRQMLDEAIKMSELGKFSPEAKPFIAGKLRTMVRHIEKVIDVLEE